MNFHPLGGALFSVASRLLMGDVELSPQNERRLRRAKSKLDEATEMTRGLDPANPGTWLQVIQRYIEYTYEECKQFDGPEQWLGAHDFREVDCPAQFLIDELFNFAAARRPEQLDQPDAHDGPLLVYDDERSELYLLRLPNGAPLVVERRPTTNRFDKPTFFPEALDRSVVFSGIAARFWQNRRAVTLDKTDGPHGRSIGFWNADLDGHTYYGELDELIDELAEFRADGTRRNVLLQGKPGCGKSTLCRHAARELSDRTVMLTADFLSSVHGREWSFLLDALRPEMLIVDDIDRMNGRLDDKLGVFEEGYCDVPIALFTSNDHTKLPVALRRPGRIDRIFEVDEPGEEVRRRIIRELAAEEGVDIPDQQFDRLLAILEEFSAAHVVEALRHARVCGWRDDPLPGDVTFDERGQEESGEHRPGWQPAVYG